MQEKLKQLEINYGIEWTEFSVSKFFDIQNTLSFNKDKLTPGNTYDYVTRTSQNQGVLQPTGFVNADNINPAGTWSLGLLQMDFFYRKKPWYAGQFVRKIVPKFELSNQSIQYFTVLLNSMKRRLLSVLVRDVDKIFLNMKIYLPTKHSKVCFEYIDSFIDVFNHERIDTLDSYLNSTGLLDCEITLQEQAALDSFSKVSWKEFDLIELFNIKNTHNILSRDIVPGSGNIPYLTAGQSNNSVGTYISYDIEQAEKGNSIFIGGKTFVVTYQKDDYFSNDSHNLALYYKDIEHRTKANQLFMATCVDKSLCSLYSWGNSISSRKIQKDTILLPVKDNVPDHDYMTLISSAMQKLVIKKVINYLEEKRKNHNVEKLENCSLA